MPEMKKHDEDRRRKRQKVKVAHYEGVFEEVVSGISWLASCNGQGGRCYNVGW